MGCCSGNNGKNKKVTNVIFLIGWSLLIGAIAFIDFFIK